MLSATRGVETICSAATLKVLSVMASLSDESDYKGRNDIGVHLRAGGGDSDADCGATCGPACAAARLSFSTLGSAQLPVTA